MLDPCRLCCHFFASKEFTTRVADQFPPCNVRSPEVWHRDEHSDTFARGKCYGQCCNHSWRRESHVAAESAGGSKLRWAQDAAGYTQPVVGSCHHLFGGPLLVQETPALMVCACIRSLYDFLFNLLKWLHLVHVVAIIQETITYFVAIQISYIHMMLVNYSYHPFSSIINHLP